MEIPTYSIHNEMARDFLCVELPKCKLCACPFGSAEIDTYNVSKFNGWPCHAQCLSSYNNTTKGWTWAPFEPDEINSPVVFTKNYLKDGEAAYDVVVRHTHSIKKSQRDVIMRTLWFPGNDVVGVLGAISKPPSSHNRKRLGNLVGKPAKPVPGHSTGDCAPFVGPVRITGPTQCVIRRRRQCRLRNKQSATVSETAG